MRESRPNENLIVVKVAASGEKRLRPAEPVWTHILHVCAFHQTRIVLLDRVAEIRIVEEIRKIRE